VELKGARGGELAELVTDHGLVHKDRDVASSVVHREGVADHVRDDRRTTAPGLDDLLLAAFMASTFFRRWVSMKGPFFRLRDIVYLPPRAASTATSNNERV